MATVCAEYWIPEDRAEEAQAAVRRRLVGYYGVRINLEPGNPGDGGKFLSISWTRSDFPQVLAVEATLDRLGLLEGSF